MHSAISRCWLIAGLLGLSSIHLFAQTPPPAPAMSVEPGLEQAVKWKWHVAPSDPKAWGLPIATPPPTLIPTTPTAISAPTPVAIQSASTNQYEVKRGDALARIAKKFSVTTEQLKLFNGLSNDLIRVGEILKIPTQAEAQALAPTPQTATKVSPDKPAEAAPAVSSDYLPLQVFLDREGFSAGPIDGKPSITFEKIRQLYLSLAGGAIDAQTFPQKAREAIGDPLTRYVLKAEDFHFILPPKAQKPDSTAIAPVAKSKGAHPVAPKAIAPSYEELLASPMLAYRTPWEFVAERFHCDETFLHALNPQLKSAPKIGTEFQVPNVVPFEIETALREPIQPLADPQHVVTASVLDLSLLVIYRSGSIVAAFPFSVARPGLRGRGLWTIQEAIPRPRLATREESNATPQTNRLFDIVTPEPTPTPPPVLLAAEKYLPAGPNNPVGILWINLTKAGSSDPLPYGLHGTSIPGQMKNQQSLGGFRLANWDIVRAARLLPVGTALEWKTSAAPKAATAAPAAAIPAPAVVTP